MNFPKQSLYEVIYMEVIKYPSVQAVNAEIKENGPLLVLVSYDGKRTIVSPIDEAMEHYILLKKAGFDEQDIDQYFRLVLDHDGADWTFVCPPDYKGIDNKVNRIAQFYKDGFAIIPEALHALGFLVGIDIPHRYRRHINFLSDGL